MTLYALEASEAQKAAAASATAASDSSARERCFRISASAIKSKQCSGLIFYLSLNCFTYILLSKNTTFFFNEDLKEDYDDDVLKTKQTKDLSPLLLIQHCRGSYLNGLLLTKYFLGNYPISSYHIGNSNIRAFGGGGITNVI